MSEYSTSQRADFIICPEEFLEFISATVTNAAEHLDCCFVPMCPDTSPYDSVTNDFSGLMAEITKRLLKKGIKCRFITEVTAESLTYWKPFIVNSQVRHIDSLKANFVLCDCQHYWGFAINIQDLLTYNNPGMEIKEHQLLLYSNNKSFIE